MDGSNGATVDTGAVPSKRQSSSSNSSSIGTSVTSHGRALYQIEPRRLHSDWWLASEVMLGVSQWPRNAHRPSFRSKHAWTPPELQAACWPSLDHTPTFGATPAILSRHIALRTLCRLQYLHGEDWPTVFGTETLSCIIHTLRVDVDRIHALFHDGCMYG